MGKNKDKKQRRLGRIKRKEQNGNKATRRWKTAMYTNIRGKSFEERFEKLKGALEAVNTCGRAKVLRRIEGDALVTLLNSVTLQTVQHSRIKRTLGHLTHISGRK